MPFWIKTYVHQASQYLVNNDHVIWSSVDWSTSVLLSRPDASRPNVSRPEVALPFKEKPSHAKDIFTVIVRFLEILSHAIHSTNFGTTPFWGQCYKTLYCPKLRLFIII
jgi:hypothetical protein